jgi:hypothetical protein
MNIELLSKVILDSLVILIIFIVYVFDIFKNKFLFSKSIMKMMYIDSEKLLIPKIVVGLVILVLMYNIPVKTAMDIPQLVENNYSCIEGKALENFSTKDKYNSFYFEDSKGMEQRIVICSLKNDIAKDETVKIYYLQHLRYGYIKE